MLQTTQMTRFISAVLALATLLFASAKGQSVVNVNVDPSKPLNILTTNLVGAWGNLGDADLASPDGLKLMKLGGISAVTYPTGSGDTADLYHWSTNKITPNAGNADDRQSPYVQGKNDFASVALALSKYGITPVMHVNYGTNAAGNGGGEPTEAAAWVAYANAEPTNGLVLGKDSAGFDWQTAGFWAKIRGEAPLATDDTSSTVDLHAPYPPSKKDNAKRKKLPALGPKTYADQLIAYSSAMKAVDSSILIGAALTLPVASLEDTSGAFASDWNPTVLKTACKSIDFASYIWHPGNSSNDEQWKTMDDGILLNGLTHTLPHILSESIAEDKANCPGGKVLHIAFSQLSQLSWPKIEHPNVLSVFAADTYAILGEDGISNANWFQLRDGRLLRATDGSSGRLPPRRPLRCRFGRARSQRPRHAPPGRHRRSNADQPRPQRCHKGESKHRRRTEPESGWISVRLWPSAAVAGGGARAVDGNARRPERHRHGACLWHRRPSLQAKISRFTSGLFRFRCREGLRKGT